MTKCWGPHGQLAATTFSLLTGAVRFPCSTSLLGRDCPRRRPLNSRKTTTAATRCPGRPSPLRLVLLWPTPRLLLPFSCCSSSISSSSSSGSRAPTYQGSFRQRRRRRCWGCWQGGCYFCSSRELHPLLLLLLLLPLPPLPPLPLPQKEAERRCL